MPLLYRELDTETQGIFALGNLSNVVGLIAWDLAGLLPTHTSPLSDSSLASWFSRRGKNWGVCESLHHTQLCIALAYKSCEEQLFKARLKQLCIHLHLQSISPFSRGENLFSISNRIFLNIVSNNSVLTEGVVNPDVFLQYKDVFYNGKIRTHPLNWTRFQWIL